MFANRLRTLFGFGLLVCGLTGLGAALAHPGNQPVPLPDPERVPAVAPEGHDPLAPPADNPAKRIAAKGIEDDDVPLGTAPTQAVVRVEEGKLIVRHRTYAQQPFVQVVGNKKVYGYRTKSAVTAETHDTGDVAVFDMKGNRLAPKVWKEQLKSDVHALVATDGKLVNPRELTLFKADTLLVVLPAPVTPQPATPYSAPLPSAFEIPAVPPGGLSVPSRNEDLPPSGPPSLVPSGTPVIPAPVPGTPPGNPGAPGVVPGGAPGTPRNPTY